MFFSNFIDVAAENVSKKIGCSVDAAAEYIENVIFNTDFDLYAFVKTILN